jgi:lipopolysaccharide transport system ATP-binding protein
MSDVVIRVENLSKSYQYGTISHGTLTRDLQSWWARIRGKGDPNAILTHSHRSGQSGQRFWALQDVSFDVKQGEIVGIIGRNGAGKSTLLKILSESTTPTKGCVKLKGRVGSLLEVGTGFHPELTGRENIYLNGAILGMTKAEIRSKFDEIVAFAELEEFIDTPVKRYSSGMYVRLAFAVAAHLEPEILLVDEVLAVGDAEFQKKCLGKMGDVSEKEGRTILFVSHDMAAIRHLCQFGIWIERGEMVFFGQSAECIELYLNSFTPPDHSESGYFALYNRTDRISNGSVLFISVRMRGHDDIQRDRFEFYEPFTIEFEVKCITSVRPCYIGFSVLSLDGANLFASHHSDSAELKALKPGNYRIVCSVHPNSLKPGRYLLSIGIGDFASWEPHDWFPNGIGQFFIEPGSGNFATHLDSRPGYLQPLFRWNWRE